jgi:hypothetical protein
MLQSKNLLSVFTHSLLLFLLLLLVSCDSASDRFRLEGRFKNLNQGEFYIYNAENGVRDTIRVRDSRFKYEHEMDQPTLFMLMFPNFSEMPIFADAGVSLMMKGDATHLRETEVKGDKVNEEMTAFRLSVNEQTPPEQQRIAKDYVKDHPDSPIALYLVLHFFVDNIDRDYPEAYKLCKAIGKAQPENKDAEQWVERLEPLRNYVKKGKLPKFSAKDTKGRSVDNSKLKSDVNVVVVWSSWNYESQNILHMLSVQQAKNPKKIGVVSICLDANEKEGRRTLDRDSIEWPNVCDGLMWESPVLKQLGLATAGANIITDKDGNIQGRDLETQKLREKIESMLK